MGESPEAIRRRENVTGRELPRFHLDPVGGVAGDMFAAAVLDLRPGLLEGLQATVSALGEPIETELLPHGDDVLAGARFTVRPSAPESGHGDVRFQDIRRRLDAAPGPAGVRVRAQAIFALLAEAEGAVHGRAPEDATFHEVGAWDSIADITAAAFLIDALGAARWSVGSIPLGSGRVNSRHGLLPVPAPAVVHLLEGFATHDDGIDGERVTPTGAAILRHLAPDQTPVRAPETLAASGIGFGERRFPGFSNMLRIVEFHPVSDRPAQERVAVLRFEVDDQTPEDLALGLDRLRAGAGVLDVVQWPAFGKNGRMLSEVQLLAEPASLEAALAAVFDETATLGVRWSEHSRCVLDRETAYYPDEEGAVRVKRAARPAGTRTAKAELKDLAESADRAARERRRRAAEAAALGEFGNG